MMKKSGMPTMSGMKKMNPMGSTKMIGAMKPVKGYAKGGVVGSQLKAMGRNMAKVKNQGSK